MKTRPLLTPGTSCYLVSFAFEVDIIKQCSQGRKASIWNQPAEKQGFFFTEVKSNWPLFNLSSFEDSDAQIPGVVLTFENLVWVVAFSLPFF